MSGTSPADAPGPRCFRVPEVTLRKSPMKGEWSCAPKAPYREIRASTCPHGRRAKGPTTSVVGTGRGRARQRPTLVRRFVPGKLNRAGSAGRGVPDGRDGVYRLFDRRCRTETALRKLARLRLRAQRFKALRQTLKKLWSPNLEKARDVPRRLTSASDIERRRADEPPLPEGAGCGIPGVDAAPRLGPHRAGLPARGEDAGPGRHLTDSPHLQSKRQGGPRTSPAHAKGGVDMAPADSLQSPVLWRFVAE